MGANDRISYQHPIPSKITINANPASLPTGLAFDNFSNISWVVSTNADGSGIIGLVPTYSPRTFTVNQPQQIFLIGSGSSVAGDVLNLEWGPDPLGSLPASYGLVGNSFYRVLSLGTVGGVYQGTGSFNAPTDGLKIWNNAGLGEIDFYKAGVSVASISANGLSFTLGSLTQAGVTWDGTSFRGPGLTLNGSGLAITQAGVTWDGTNFRGAGGSVTLDATGLKTFNAGTLQCSVGSDGVLTAGAGAVKLDAAGIHLSYASIGLVLPSASFAYSWNDGLGNTPGAIYNYKSNSVSNHLDVIANGVTGIDTQISILATAALGKSGTTRLVGQDGPGGVFSEFSVSTSGLNFNGPSITAAFVIDASGNLTGKGFGHFATNLSIGTAQATGTTLQIGSAGGAGLLGTILFGDTNHTISVNADAFTFRDFAGVWNYTNAADATNVQASVLAGVFRLYAQNYSPVVNTGTGNNKVGLTAGLTAIGSGGTTVTFPNAFSSTPIVVATAQSGSALIVSISATTTTGFTVKVFNTAGTAVANSIYWWAVAAFT